MKNTLFLLLIIIISCGKSEDIIAQIGDVKLTKDNLLISQEKWDLFSKEEKSKFVKDWINLTILSTEADKLGISQNEIILNQIEIAKNNIKSNAVISRKLSSITVSEDELFNYYKINKTKFQERKNEYYVQRIEIKDKQKLEKIRKFIKENSFTDAAKKFSTESIGENGGFLGWVSAENSDLLFWNTLRELKKYRYKTVEKKDKYDLIQYTDFREINKNKSFIEVKKEIKKIVLENKKSETYFKYIEELKRDKEIIISL